ncbi:GH92 family glycosyl hydrolase [Reichenbachiella sp. MALMAid0571]|uniref:GH92 family glycosyl hydrolase n=1 Tax=Reichenbachiella sp. MALMAid0571 TaxID=3143939 RepID=UPI0032DEA2E2
MMTKVLKSTMKTMGTGFFLLSLLFGNALAQRPVDLVNPFVDAANSRWFFFTSASRPFGMVNLSPDMGLGGAWDSGYRYDQDTIRFFSHIHAWQLSGVPVLPTIGEFKGHLSPHAYGSKYSHENETASPGYHSVLLEDYGIKAELTSTTRVGFHRYTFPKSNQSHILLDMNTELGPSGTDAGYVKKLSNTKIEGYTIMEATIRRPKPTYVYFSIEFDKPFLELNAWQNGKLLGKVKKFEGENGGVYVKFDTEKDEVIQMKVGISYVSEAQARLNMDTELPHWDFDRIVTESKDVWNEHLGRIKIEGNTQKQQSRFYTDLWHAIQGRRIISDANGQYCDMTGDKKRTGQIPLDANGQPKFNHYNSDSFWGAQWTINTLWHLVYPEVTEGFVNSMLMMYDDGGMIPRGPAGGNYTYVMTGASSTPFIVSAYMKGIRGFDAEKAYEGMRKNAMPGGIMGKAGYEHDTDLGGGLKYYIENGFVPYPMPDKNKGFHNDGTGQTLEYAYQDWCLAQMAKDLGKDDDYEMFMKRAQNYKNVFDTSIGWSRTRNVDGKWQEPFDILEYHHGYVESNSVQATWFVPHDLQGLFDLMGGKEAAATMLDRQFNIADQHNFVSHNFRNDPFVKRERKRTWLNYGNQPSMQVGYIFNYAGQPWLTQYWTREIVNRIYSDLDPWHGYNGDEDQGLMGSLAVLMKMGIFEMRGGAAKNPEIQVGSPIFDKVTIQLNPDYYKGRKFEIETINNSDKNRYLQSIDLNGKNLNKVWLNHSDVVNGGTLKLEMGSKPNKNLGSEKQTLPGSVSK